MKIPVPTSSNQGMRDLSISKKDQSSVEATVLDGEMSESDNATDINEDFFQIYRSGDKEEAKKYLDQIDPNYNDGDFIIIAVQENDLDLLDKLFEKGANKSIQDAFALAVRNGYFECAERLIQQEANPRLVIGTSAYTNHKEAKSFIDKKILEMQETASKTIANINNFA